jgi:hypothetical protein
VRPPRATRGAERRDRLAQVRKIARTATASAA